MIKSVKQCIYDEYNDLKLMWNRDDINEIWGYYNITISQSAYNSLTPEDLQFFKALKIIFGVCRDDDGLVKYTRIKFEYKCSNDSHHNCGCQCEMCKFPSIQEGSDKK